MVAEVVDCPSRVEPLVPREKKDAEMERLGRHFNENSDLRVESAIVVGVISGGCMMLYALVLTSIYTQDT